MENKILFFFAAISALASFFTIANTIFPGIFRRMRAKFIDLNKKDFESTANLTKNGTFEDRFLGLDSNIKIALFFVFLNMVFSVAVINYTIKERDLDYSNAALKNKVAELENQVNELKVEYSKLLIVKLSEIEK